jgi:hypothetical protein
MYDILIAGETPKFGGNFKHARTVLISTRRLTHLAAFESQRAGGVGDL